MCRDICRGFTTISVAIYGAVEKKKRPTQCAGRFSG